MNYAMYIVDAFADKPFTGNPAAVVPLVEWLPDALMQSIAAENNLSETAFLVHQADGRFHIRWFSPISEIPFCGHATLASAFVLMHELGRAQPLVFHAKAVGDITDGARGVLVGLVGGPQASPHPGLLPRRRLPPLGRPAERRFRHRACAPAPRPPGGGCHWPIAGSRCFPAR